MANKVADIILNTVEDLLPYKNKNNLIEIIVRRKNGTIKKIYKCALGQLSSEQAQKAAEIVKKASDNGNKLINILNKGASAAGWISAGASILNLGVTVAGFAAMDQRLDAIDKKLDDLKSELGKVSQNVEAGNKISNEFLMRREFHDLKIMTKKIIGDRNAGIAVPREEMYSLLKEYESYISSVLNIRGYVDFGEVLQIVYMLLPMFQMLILAFDETYFDYYANHAGHVDPNHEDWMKLFDRISGCEFTDDTEDYCCLSQNMHNAAVQKTLRDQAQLNAALKEEIEDTVALLRECGSTENYRKVVAAMNQAAAEESSDIMDVLMQADPKQAQNIYDIARAQVLTSVA